MQENVFKVIAEEYSMFLERVGGHVMDTLKHQIQFS